MKYVRSWPPHGTYRVWPYAQTSGRLVWRCETACSVQLSNRRARRMRLLYTACSERAWSVCPQRSLIRDCLLHEHEVSDTVLASLHTRIEVTAAV